MKYISLLLLLSGMSVTTAYAQTTDSFSLVALDQVNAFRDSLHLPRVTLAKTLSAGCRSHARYLVINRDNSKTQGLLGHKEFSELPGYSKAGEAAGSHSVIGFPIDPKTIVPQLLATFYHRMPFMQPNLAEIGFGSWKDTNWYVTVLDCSTSMASGRSDAQIVAYPYNGQVNVPLKMQEELPDPINHSLGDGGAGGFPVTFFFATYQSVTNVSFSLTDEAGNDVVCYVSSPEKPATDFSQWFTVCAIPASPLKPTTKYTASLSCTVNDQPYKDQLSFTTTAE